MTRQSTETTSHTHNPNEQQSDSPNSRVCDECGGRINSTDSHGELICNDCGLVISESEIDHGPEWRGFETEDKTEHRRVGPPMREDMYDKGLATDIDWRDTDTNGNTLSERNRQRMNRLRKWNKRYKKKSQSDRHLKKALDEVRRISSALGLHTQTRETASVLYRQCLDKDLIKGRSIETVAAACVYTASRQCESPRTLEQVHRVSRVHTQQTDHSPVSTRINRAYCKIADELGLAMEPVDPRNYLNRFVTNIDQHVTNQPELITTAQDVLTAAEETQYHVGKAPTTLAASAIYAAIRLTDRDIQQKETAEATDVSEVSIRNHYRKLMDTYNQNQQ